jgi:hypothetical protein
LQNTRRPADLPSNPVKSAKHKDPTFKLDYDKLHVKEDEIVLAELETEVESIRSESSKKMKDTGKSKSKKKQKKKGHINDDARKLEEFLGSDYISSISNRNEQEYDQL